MRNQQPTYVTITIAVTTLLLISSRGLFGQDTAGIGVYLSKDGDHVVIGKLLPDGSAAKSGKLGVGDWIVAVSDSSIPNTDVSSSSIDAIVPLIRGKAGTEIYLTVVSKGKKIESAYTLPLRRGSIPILEKWGDGNLIPAGKEFPKIEMTLLDGTAQTLKSADLGERIAVFEIWSTSCGPCLKLMADHQALAAKYAQMSKEIVFITASVDDKSEVAMDLLSNRNWKATTNVWLNDVAIKALHIKSIPVIYIFDAKGVVLANSDEEGFQKTINEILENLPTK
jgi:thiol-disulfide isomerase/thioredoxin